MGRKCATGSKTSCTQPLGEEHHSVVDKVVKLARLQKDGFDDMTSEDVNGLIELLTESR